jgi:hypothetical protein
MMITQGKKPYRLVGPNPLMFNQASSDGWGDGGYWLNADNFGISKKISATAYERRLDLRGQIEEIADEHVDISDSQWGKPVNPEEDPRPKGRAKVLDDSMSIEYLQNVEDRDSFFAVNLNDEKDNKEDDMIRNIDGTPYNPDSSTVAQFDPDSPDHLLMDEIDQESIDLGGAPVEYYRVLVDGNADEFYGEQREKRYAQRLYKLMAHWEPVQPEWNWMPGGAGFSSEELTAFSFNRATFLEKVGEMPRVGSLIKTCTDNVFWEITKINVNIEGEDRKLWGKHRVSVMTQKYQSTITDPSPTGMGRESYSQGKKGGVTIR